MDDADISQLVNQYQNDDISVNSSILDDIDSNLQYQYKSLSTQIQEEHTKNEAKQPIQNQLSNILDKLKGKNKKNVIASSNSNSLKNKTSKGQVFQNKAKVGNKNIPLTVKQQNPNKVKPTITRSNSLCILQRQSKESLKRKSQTLFIQQRIKYSRQKRQCSFKPITNELINRNLIPFQNKENVSALSNIRDKLYKQTGSKDKKYIAGLRELRMNPSNPTKSIPKRTFEQKQGKFKVYMNLLQQSNRLFQELKRIRDQNNVLSDLLHH